MSINSILNNGNSGIQAAQTQLRVVSDNVANVDTTGYIRKVANQQAQVTSGQGSGVSITQIQNVTDQFLQAATLSAGAQSGQSSITSSILDQAQSLFGDPSTTGSYFSTLDNVFSAFSSLAANPTTAGQTQALSQVTTFFNQSSALSTSLGQLSSQVDKQLQSDVGTANQLLQQIDGLNADISRANAAGGDATGSQNQQSQLIDQLSSLMDVKVTSLSNGGAVVRASDGTALAGDGSGPATLSYDASGTTGQLAITNGAGVTQPLGARLTSGEMKGLLDLRNTELPQVAGQLSELTSGVADQLNAIHNAYSSVPPPSTMTGESTGLDATGSVAGFIGKTTIAEVNQSTGVLDHRIDIDFDAGTVSVDGGTATNFTPATFVATLNTALGTGGSASFTGGVLKLTAPSGDGLAIQDDATTPASNGGKGFSDYFGLNNLVSSSTLTNYNTGLSSTDASGFPAGQTLKLQIADANGTAIKDVTVTTPAGTTMAAMLGALNASPSGVGGYGSFALDANGQLSFTAATGSGLGLSVLQDNTQNAAGASLSQLFGIGDAARNSRAGSYSVRSDLLAAPSTLSTAALNLGVPSGQAVLEAGDTSGADALGQAGTATHSFSAAGGVAATTTSVSDYASTISASIARKSANADAADTQAQSVATEATSRRSSYEGVNLDDELVKLTTYQQAYNASARMVQAAKDMYDTLINMVS